MRNGLICVLGLALASGCSGPSNPTGDTGADDASATDGATPTDDVPAADVPVIGPMGGTVDRFRFGVFGDVRPANQDDTAHYPTMVIGQVMDGMQSFAPQFAVGTGDYMFARSEDVASRQLDLLLAAAQRFQPPIFYALGNHECTGGTTSNCPNANETGNVRQYRSRLIPAQPGLYFDYVVTTSMGDAHFIVTAPNAWSSSQDAWLTRVMAQPARYTFVVAHEAPTSQDMGPGSTAVETAIQMRTGGVTLRLYGHTHDYRRIGANAIIAGNAGAPLNDAMSAYGFVIVEQRADGNVTVTSYELGTPPMVAETFAVHPDGTSAR